MTTIILLCALSAHLIIMLGGTLILMRALGSGTSQAMGVLDVRFMSLSADVAVALARLPKTRARRGAVSPRPPQVTTPDGAGK